ncbi:hypothetical protein GGD81_001643 [Rhodobium orientis]|uniref:sulfotransferase family protein n=1 Tax=Rhodobium orientis TaxID=34017 RepID=UPI001475696C|nr:sulfotransferase family protein [Rhodobium orientis]MBB4302613.1 hypothetical protein [Rhodobium orientis]
MASFFGNLRERFRGPPPAAKAEHFVVIPDLKIAFGRVPKAANSSIKAALARHVSHDPDGPVKPTRDQFWAECTNGRTSMMTPAEAARLAGYLIFTFTRNPFDRLVSCYNNKIVVSKELPASFARLGFDKDMSFDAFAAKVATIDDGHADIHFQSQAAMLAHDGDIVPGFIGRFENLADDWHDLDAALAAHCGIRLGRLEKRNYRRGGADDLAGYYRSNETVALVRQRYADDFRLFYPDAGAPGGA